VPKRYYQEDLETAVSIFLWGDVAMKRLLISVILVFFCFNQSLACSSDCYQCHSNIPNDKNHRVLKTCTNCHPEHSEKDFGSKCGADCFDCHSAQKVMKSSKAHKVIKKCINCHEKLEASQYNEIYRELLK
jgi:hypothetical protein